MKNIVMGVNGELMGLADYIYPRLAVLKYVRMVAERRQLSLA